MKIISKDDFFRLSFVFIIFVGTLFLVHVISFYDVSGNQQYLKCLNQCGGNKASAFFEGKISEGLTCRCLEEDKYTEYICRKYGCNLNSQNSEISELYGLQDNGCVFSHCLNQKPTNNGMCNCEQFRGNGDFWFCGDKLFEDCEYDYSGDLHCYKVVNTEELDIISIDNFTQVCPTYTHCDTMCDAGFW